MEKTVIVEKEKKLMGVGGGGGGSTCSTQRQHSTQYDCGGDGAWAPLIHSISSLNSPTGEVGKPKK